MACTSVVARLPTIRGNVSEPTVRPDRFSVCAASNRGQRMRDLLDKPAFKEPRGRAALPRVQIKAGIGTITSGFRTGMRSTRVCAPRLR